MSYLDVSITQFLAYRIYVLINPNMQSVHFMTQGPCSAYPISDLFDFFFQPEQYFSLTTIQPEQCFQLVSAKILPAERGLISKNL